MKISNEELSTSVYLNEDRTEAKLHFWPINSDDAYLVFNVQTKPELLITPIRIEATTSENNVGMKIVVEVVNNGFIVNIDKEINIATTEYDMRMLLTDAIVVKTDHSFKYDKDEHSFKNIENAYQLIQDELNK